MTRRGTALVLSFSRNRLRAALPAPLKAVTGTAVFSTIILVTTILLTTMVQAGWTQTGPYERTFHQPKSTVEKALKELQPAMSGRLPVLDGFALAGNHPLDLYRRAYYQSAVQVSSTPSGESVVRVSTKLTAWYTDSVPSHSGYQMLISNGRLESDLLDQLADLLANRPSAASSGEHSGERSSGKGAEQPVLSAPIPQSQEESPGKLPGTGRALSSPLGQGLAGQHLADARTSPETPAQTSLQAEAASLEEVLKNQAHPKNIVAIKKSGTPVVATPSLTGKTLFMASAQDEFEMLDFNADWVHVRISGLSRGWIWRTSLEMPEGISDVPLAQPPGARVAADLFQVSREETAPFPGDWEPLRGRNVKIISVQKIQENEENSGAQAKLEYAKALLDKSYTELAAKSQEVAGVVMIFDSVDGGMIAATLPTIGQWKAGRLSDAGLWHQCYFDPPETFSVSSPSGGH